MDFIKILSTLLELLHLLVRFLPLGVFFFTYLSSALYKDLRRQDKELRLLLT